MPYRDCAFDIEQRVRRRMARFEQGYENLLYNFVYPMPPLYVFEHISHTFRGYSVNVTTPPRPRRRISREALASARTAS